MGKGPVIFISCGIFRDELEYLIKKEDLDMKVVFLDAALHVNFDRLKEKLVAALEENRKPGAELKVLYGHCHPEMMEILDRYKAKKLAAPNCLAAMAGADEITRIDDEGKAFYLTTGWANNWEAMFDKGKEDFNFDFKNMFSNYRRIVVFETGVTPIDEEKVRKLSELTGLPTERRKITLSHFLGLIKSL